LCKPAAAVIYDKHNSNGGTVSIESAKYRYGVVNNALAELSVSENDSHYPLATCSLTVSDNRAGISFAKYAEHADHNSLLLALCWYLFLPVAKENVIAYSAA
jgi:hypothetical protein